jgi:hypothetical protein
MKFSILQGPASCSILKLIRFYHCRQLDYNNITSITKGWLYGLSSLLQLTLANNHIASIEEDGWEFCQLLKEL